MNIIRNSFLLVFALIAVAAPAHAQQVFTRFASTVPDVVGWNYAPQARGEASDDGACSQGRTRDCSANCPTGLPGSNVYLWATDFVDFVQQPCPAITKVKISVRTGFGDNNSTAAGEIQMRIRGPFNEVTLPLLNISGNQTWRGPDGGGWDITGLLGRAWTVADVNALQVGIRRVSRSAPSTFLWVDGYRIQVEVPDPPTLTLSSPATQQVSVGQTAVLTTTASGTAPLNYRWAVQEPGYGNGWRPLSDGPYSLNGVVLCNVQGAETTTLQVTPVSAVPPVLYFQGSAANPCGLAVSGTASVNSCTPVSVSLATPNTQTVDVGQTAVLSINTGGSAPLNYRWAVQEAGYGNGWRPLFDGPYSLNGIVLCNVQGAETTTLRVTPVSAVPTVLYFQGSAANPCGLAVTGTASVNSCRTVSVALAVDRDQSVALGQTATLSITASGSAPMNYRWAVQDPSYGNGWRPLFDGPYIVNGVALFSVHGAETTSLTVTLHAASPITHYFQGSAGNPCSLGVSQTASIRRCNIDNGFILESPTAQTVPRGTRATLAGDGYGSGFTIINVWEVRDDSYPGDWRPLSDGPQVFIGGQPYLIEGSRSTILSVTPLGDVSTTAFFRLCATRTILFQYGDICSSRYSNVVSITSCVPPAGMSITPLIQSVCPNESASLLAATSLSGQVSHRWLLEVPSSSGNYVLLSDGRFTDPTSGLSFECSGTMSPQITATNFRLHQWHGNLNFKTIASNVSGSYTSCAARMTVNRTCFSAGIIDADENNQPTPRSSIRGVVRVRGGQGTGSTGGGLAGIATLGITLLDDEIGTRIQVDGRSDCLDGGFTGMRTFNPVVFNIPEITTFSIAQTGDAPRVQLFAITGSVRGSTTFDTDGVLYPGSYGLDFRVESNPSNQRQDVRLIIRLGGNPSCGIADITGGGQSGLIPDGTIDGDDFITFVNSFSIGDQTIDPAADVAGGGREGNEPDGIVDGGDFIAFINSFSAGC